MLFAEYYGSPFRSDIAAIVAGLPPRHDHDPTAIVLQPRTLSTENPAVRALSEERKGLFACALFLTIAADQVCYFHFRSAYPRFSALTRYPKLKGDCPGGCSTNIHPQNAFAIGSRPGRRDRSILDFQGLLPPDVLDVMRAEILSFVSERMTALDAEEFWAHVDREIPLELRLAVRLTRPAL